jgi:hypothetical protein
VARARAWWAAREPLDRAFWRRDVPAWFCSMFLHGCIIVGMTLIATTEVYEEHLAPLLAETVEELDPLTTSEEFSYSETPQEEIGSSSSGTGEVDFSVAPVMSLEPTLGGLEMQSAPPEVVDLAPMREEIQLATGPKFTENLPVMGAAGVGAVGTGGAIDRITQEILLSLEERPTLVVWLFDQSGSLARQRDDIIKRFKRIYEELGVVEASGNKAFARHEDKPLLTSVVAFGQNVTFLTPKPTDDINEITAAVGDIETDESGVEQTFGAVTQAIERYRVLRTQEPRRNIKIVLFTDETGDDEDALDRTVTIARRLEIPIYCIGVPAPFGRRDASIKYVDPDPKFDQTPQWIPVRQGPESFMPELVKIGEENEDPLDSGFGPYSLTRLCFETGGIFFSVHPNRTEGDGVSREKTAVLSARFRHFFDPDVMRNYRPDYVSIKEYQRLISQNRARQALVQAAQMSWVTPMESPQLQFRKRNEADLAGQLSRAQQDAAVLEPKINRLYETLARGEADRKRLTTPRWQAGYDLSLGRVLALKVRTEGYNAMLAKAKQGMQFKDPKNDTWVLVRDNEISVGSALEKQAKEAKSNLERVVQEHPGTPWAMLAERELREPFGWKWEERYTGVNEPAVANNVPRRAPQPMKPPPPRRTPKL